MKLAPALADCAGTNFTISVAVTENYSKRKARSLLNCLKYNTSFVLQIQGPVLNASLTDRIH